MRILRFLFLILFLFSSACFAFEEDLNSREEEFEDVPVGMEAFQVTNGHRIIAPIGAKIKKIGAQIIVEGDKEYYSRRFFELTQEIDTLKESISSLKDQVDALIQETKDQNHDVESDENIVEQEKEQM